MRLKYYFYLGRAYLSVVLRDLRAGFPLPALRKLACWKNGFLAEKYVLYDLEKNSYKNYISDVHASMARWVNDPYTDVLSNKFLFEKVAGFAIAVPRTLGLILDGRLAYWTGGATRNGSWEVLFEACQSASLILKPVVGGGGKGVMLLSKCDDGNVILVDGRNVSRSEAISMFEGLNDYLISEYAAQGAFAKSLNPTTTNTMRIVTLFDYENQAPFIARAVQRIGNKKSSPFDNFTKGGLSAMIDVDTGRLGPAASHPDSMTLRWHSTHPDTGLPIENCIVPGWADIQQQILDAASKLPFLKCIGWDLMQTDDGVVAIEGNHHPDPDVLQCHGALLIDARVNRFYKRHSVIS